MTNPFDWLQSAPSLLFGQKEPTGTRSTTGYSRGVDIPLALDTPIGNLLPGTVVEAGYHHWGGQVDIATVLNGQRTIEEYLHLDQIAVLPGQEVASGQLVGLSGGQLTGGVHPATADYSTGPHIKYSLSQSGQPIDPGSILEAARGGLAGWLGGAAGSVQQIGQGASDLGTGISNIAANLARVTTFFTSGDFVKVAFGGLLILLALLILLFGKARTTAEQILPVAVAASS